MELLVQAWDEVDDTLAALRHVLARYAFGEVLVLTAAVLRAMRLRRAAAMTRRGSLRMRTA